MVETIARLQDVFRDVFDDEQIVLCRSTSAEDIPGWDSIMHVNLILSAEQAFGIRFTSAQVGSLKDVGDLVDLIDALRGGA